MQTDNALISVIVPVYKAEKYLERSIDSIIGQTYGHLEIILVEDGSPDKCGAICDAYAKKDPRIKVIHKANGGASSARNAALDIAAGDYIGFADADDWMEPNMYQMLLDVMLSSNADISACGIRLCSENGHTSYWNNNLKLKKVFSKEEALSELHTEKLLTFSMWNKLYKRDVIGNQKFVEGIIYEDNEFLPKCIAKAEKVVFCGEVGYNHFLTPISVMRDRYSIKHYDLITVSRENIRFYEKECPSLLNYIKSRYLIVVLGVIYRSHGIKEWQEKRKELISEIRKPVLNSVLKCLDIKNKVKLAVCRISPEIYSMIMIFAENVYKLRNHV